MWPNRDAYEHYADTDEHKADFIAFVEKWVHHIDHGLAPNQARGGVIMMNGPHWNVGDPVTNCDTGCDATNASSDLSACPCIEWASRFPQTSGAQIMADVSAWVATHDPTQQSHADLTNALDATTAVLSNDDLDVASRTSKSVVFAISNYYVAEFSDLSAQITAVTNMQTPANEDWNVYFLSISDQLPSAQTAHWGDHKKGTYFMPGWLPSGYSGDSPTNGHEIMQEWAEHSCPPPAPMYALAATDKRCDIPAISGFTSYVWPNTASYASCCSNTDDWSGVVSGQSFAQLRANCEAACSSGVHGHCNVITYFESDANCNLGYYDDRIRSALVDSVINDECTSHTGMSVWVLAPGDAYTLVGAGTKCDIHTSQTWENGNNFAPCCKQHDGGPLDDPDSQSFEELKANCEAACDGWAATGGPGTCNVITYQDNNRCELGYHAAGTAAFEQSIVDGACISDPRYYTYVRNAPLERVDATAACFMDSAHGIYPCTGCIDGDKAHLSTHLGCQTSQNDGNPHVLDVYFPSADVTRVVVHNRRGGNCYGTHCTYRLGHEGWQVWYLPTSAGQGAYVEDAHPYVAHWVMCFNTTEPTLNVYSIEVDCVASNVFGVRIVQLYQDTMNLNEVEVYGTTLAGANNDCVLSGAAHPSTGHDCSPAPGPLTDDAFCKDTGHGGCPAAWCCGSCPSGKCAQ